MKTLTEKIPWYKKFLAKRYYNQGFIYLNRYNSQPMHSSSQIKWLEEIKIIATSPKKADKISFDYFNKKHPQYKGFVNLF